MRPEERERAAWRAAAKAAEAEAALGLPSGGLANSDLRFARVLLAAASLLRLRGGGSQEKLTVTRPRGRAGGCCRCIGCDMRWQRRRRRVPRL